MDLSSKRPSILNVADLINFFTQLYVTASGEKTALGSVICIYIYICVYICVFVLYTENWPARSFVDRLAFV